MKENIDIFLKNGAVDTFLPIKVEKKAVEFFNLSFKEVERVALKLGITPLRYKRNQSTISVENQLKLLNAHVAIIGSGGLGGHIAEILTRIGVGTLTIFDFDVFEEHNLNRQNFSNYENLGEEKVLVVKKGIEKINPALHVNAFVEKFDPLKDMIKLENIDIVVDALDNPQTKLDLSYACKERNIPFIHGAIAGLNGQFISCCTLENLYREGSSGIEKSIGNPSFSVTFAASIQSCEVIKKLLNFGDILQDKILMTNLLENEFIIL